MSVIIPDFTAYDMNTLQRIGRRQLKYADARKLIRQVEAGTTVLSEGQIRWLWVIKRELKEM